MMDICCEKCSHGILRVPGHEEDLRELVKFTNYYKGELITQQGESILGYHILCQGYVKVLRRTKEGKTRLLRIIGPGDLIDKSSLFSKKRSYSFYVESMTDVQIAFILKEDLSYWLKNYHQAVKKVISSIANELDIQYKKATWDAWESSLKRLIRALFILEGGNQIYPTKPPQPSKTDLASALGITRETLSRHLHLLEEQGLIKLQRGNYKIVDEDRLKNVLAGL